MANIATVSPKGGVGKTALALILAEMYQHAGYVVGLADCDVAEMAELESVSVELKAALAVSPSRAFEAVITKLDKRLEELRETRDTSMTLSMVAE